MHIVKTIPEFLELLKRPNPNEIYGLVPDGYKVLNIKLITDVFQTRINTVLYGDISETHGPYKVIRHNPSFDEEVLRRGFMLNSPLFVRTQNPMFSDRENINELALQLLQQAIGKHIPQVIFAWNPDLLTETNTQ
jgi:hypothetical protein